MQSSTRVSPVSKPVNVGDAALRETAERVVTDLEAAGLDALLDDRDERPGPKFKDADLIGLPVRITVGPRALARGCVEVKPRAGADVSEVPVSEVGNTHASRVIPVLRSMAAESATFTRDVVPLNVRALPTCPAVDQVVLVRVPLLPPARFAVVVPVPSLKP